ncbi:hypothetical protein BRADI_5g15462v3 [Brachypodium distachyon]|uniref:Uncharacterized protein n=1 Tax=Brachypodium distachyon TaxID=15368 RepID=A0A0Q3P3Y8_BRADI|nr:hypothetical protein BRADI_5g15462v3 [Brachypodium distachyon]KQJ83530.1 hypothetical protein BRADI_5g15462v3 [Brachypodium distachyon]
MEFVGQLCSNGYEYVCHGRDRAALRGDGSLVAVATPLAAAVLGVQGVRSGSSSTILSSPSSLECSVGIIAKCDWSFMFGAENLDTFSAEEKGEFVKEIDIIIAHVRNGSPRLPAIPRSPPSTIDSAGSAPIISHLVLHPNALLLRHVEPAPPRLPI